MEREMEEVTAEGGGMSPVRVAGSASDRSCFSLEMEDWWKKPLCFIFQLKMVLKG